MKIEKAIAPEKIRMFSDYDDTVKRIIASSKLEVENLNHQREVLILKNNQLDQELNRKQGQFDQNLRIEKQKHQDWINKSKNDEIARMQKVEFAEQNWVRRDEEMKRREAIGIAILEKNTKLNNDRIEIEKLRSGASAMIDEANRKMSDAMSKFSQANIAETKAKDTLGKANAINDSLNQRENTLKIEKKNVEEAVKNLNILKEIVDPKIKEIKLVEDNIEIWKKDLKSKEDEIDRKIFEEKELLKTVEMAQKKLKEREKQLDQKEEEITRKAILNKINA